MLSQAHSRLFNERESLKESLAKINQKINPLLMDIKEVKCDLTGETMFVIYHTTGESFFTRCCPFSKGQLDYLKQILVAIILSDGGQIGHIEALNTCEGLSKSEADAALGSFLQAKLLSRVKGRAYCLSPLTVVEFAQFFNNSFPDNLHSCDLCKQLVFVGKTCQGCSNKFHYHCRRKWLTNRSDCPNCQMSWNSGSQDSDTE